MSFNNKLFYKVQVFVGFVALVANNLISGWGTHHHAAAFVDGVAGIAIGWGILGDLTNNVTITKNETHNVNTEHLTLEDRRGADAKTNLITTKVDKV